MALTFIPDYHGKLPSQLASLRREILRYAPDHKDRAEHMQAIEILAEASRRVRELAAMAAYAAPLIALAADIEDCGWPLEMEAMRWDDERDGRAQGDLLDQRMV